MASRASTNSVQTTGMPPHFPSAAFDRLLPWAFAEDEGNGDVTSLATIDASTQGTATLICKEEGVLAGLPLVESVIHFRQLQVEINAFHSDGDWVKAGTKVMTLNGPLQALLSCERIILNFLQRFSGIATATHLYVQAVAGSNMKILDTRKTLPVYRELDKYAVAVGGGKNHRMGLYDMVLVKDNHADACGSVREAVLRAHARYGEKYIIEAEVRSLAEIETLLDTPVQILLLDNMDDQLLQKSVTLVRSHANLRSEMEPKAPPIQLEASGNMDLSRVKRLRQMNNGSGIDLDFISVGALTHSVKALDLSLKIHKSSNPNFSQNISTHPSQSMGE